MTSANPNTPGQEQPPRHTAQGPPYTDTEEGVNLDFSKIEPGEARHPVVLGKVSRNASALCKVLSHVGFFQSSLDLRG